MQNNSIERKGHRKHHIQRHSVIKSKTFQNMNALSDNKEFSFDVSCRISLTWPEFWLSAWGLVHFQLILAKNCSLIQEKTIWLTCKVTNHTLFIYFLVVFWGWEIKETTVSSGPDEEMFLKLCVDFVFRFFSIQKT